MSQINLINNLSSTRLVTLQTCPRKFLCSSDATIKRDSINNADLSFGSMVGAGVAELFRAKNVEDAVFVALTHWRDTYFAEKPKAKKSVSYAQIAIEKFYHTLLPLYLENYELASFPDMQVDGVELGFLIQCPNDVVYTSFIDIVLQHKVTKAYKILECKTSGGAPTAAKYRNNHQGTVYTIVADELAYRYNCSVDNIIDYIVYDSVAMKWSILDFVKTDQAKDEFLNSLHAYAVTIHNYKNNNHFPMNGNNCTTFDRECTFYLSCDAPSYLEAIEHTTAEDVYAQYPVTLSLQKLMQLYAED